MTNMNEPRYLKTILRRTSNSFGYMYSLMRFLDNNGSKYAWRVSRHDELLMISEPLRRDIDRQEYGMKRALERAGITEYFDVLFCATADDLVTIPYVNPERKITIMERKIGASTSKDGKVEKLDEKYTGVKVIITSKKLQLEFSTVPNQETETWTVKNMRSRMKDHGLTGDWTPVGSW
uniref:WGS project CBMI000000000 data, contig CS3069_c002737 n=1 Tax=Fusarium clavum TaxID=2594811 RepID=A0A090MJ43_9HYPO|nr:unnamed protein product [Fusarium clavum]